MSWTKRYCDTQHLEGVLPGYQVTVTHWRSSSDVMVLQGLKTLAEATVFETGALARAPGPHEEVADAPDERARALGEELAKALRVLKSDELPRQKRGRP